MDNKNNIEQFDDLFKQAFDQASVTPPPGVWEAVSAGTTGATTAAGTSVIAKLASIKAAAILGSVALVVTTLVVLNQNNPELPGVEDKTPVVKTEEVVSNQPETNQDSPEIATENVGESQDLGSKSPNGVEQSKDPANTKSTNELNPGGLENGTSDVNNSGTSSNGSTSTDKQDERVETVSQPKVSLRASAADVCLNASVELTLVSSDKVASLAWVMDGKLLSTQGQSLRILMVKPGAHVVSVSGKTAGGYAFTKEQNVTVRSASAEFDFTDRGNGWVDLTSNRAVMTSQWYANQLLIGENKRELSYHTTESEVQFVHMVTDVNGCKDTAVQNYKAKDACDFEIIIRDAITPYLLDGKNDQLDIDMPEVENYHFTVYDPSNANVIFDTNDPEVSWNGRFENIGALVPVGQYVYRLIYDCGGKTVTKRGKVEVKD